MSRRRGVTFVETCVAGALLVGILSSLAFAMSGARRSEGIATLHLGLMESVSLAMHQLRTDLRQVSFVPGKPVMPYSIQGGPDGKSIRMRRSSHRVGAWLGSSFVVVEYKLVPAEARTDRYHLVRSEFTASGANLPGKSVSREDRVFRSFLLASAAFSYDENDEKDVRLLHVAFRVVTDSGPQAGWGPFCEKELLLTNVLSVLRPEPALAYPSLFAQPVMVQAEHPPADVLAPDAPDAGPLNDVVPGGAP